MTTIDLISPLGSEFLKDFPFQNSQNMDRIDAFATPCLPSQPLRTWTPILTAVTTSPILGTGGLIRGYYYQIFDQIYAWGEFRFGTAAINIGSGSYLMSLPFTASTIVGASTTIGSAPILGTGLIWDNSAAAGRFPVTVHMSDVNTVRFGYNMTSGFATREVSNTTPIAWAVSDGITWSLRYKKA